MSDIAAPERGLSVSTTQTLFATFLRIVSFYCVLAGLLYWIRLIGYFQGSTWRFDLMPVYWQVACSTLAVFFPFAAIGLWMMASWGPVTWSICALIEIAMYGVFPNIFGSDWIVLMLHAFTAVLYLAFRIVLHRQELIAERDG